MAKLRRARRRLTSFGATVAHLLESLRVTQTEVAIYAKCSVSNVSHLVTGERRASARWADLVADALELQAAERTALHRAAARDQGFKIDLG